MTRKWTTLALVSTLGSLFGCAQLSTGQPTAAGSGGTAQEVLPVKVAAVSAAAHLRGAAPGAESAYLMGRAAHGAGQLGEARAHYARVLAQDPRHVGALNAMAVIHAQEGRLDDALKLFGAAMEVAPQAAHLHNNAGYALLRANRLDEAEEALLRARDLDPSGQQVAQNLVLLRAAQGRAGEGAVTALGKPQVGGQAEPESGPRLVKVAPQVYALQPAVDQSTEAQTTAAPIAALPPAARPLRGVRVEVANGVGTSRLARRTADRLAITGLVAARLTNAKPYRQATTEIQFGPGQEQLAHVLRSHLPVAAKVVAASRPQAGVQMRLVLGHDLTGKAIAAWLEGIDEYQQAAWAKHEGWAWS